MVMVMVAWAKSVGKKDVGQDVLGQDDRNPGIQAAKFQYYLSV